MSKYINTKKVIPIGTALVGLLFIFTGITKYGFWEHGKGPTPGFVPIIIATLMTAVSILAFVQSFKEEKPVFPWENTLVILAGAAIFGATFLIGLIPSVAIYVIVWLKVLEKCSWKQTITVFVVIMAIVLGVFVLWLKVPFPEGLLFETLLG